MVRATQEPLTVELAERTPIQVDIRICQLILVMAPRDCIVILVEARTMLEGVGSKI